MKNLLSLSALAASVAILSSCGSALYLETSAPEEMGLNLVKITNESNNTVMAPVMDNYFSAYSYGLYKQFYYHLGQYPKR